MKKRRKIRLGISCLSLAILIILTASGCAENNNMGDLNLTYIGEARDKTSNLTYFLQGPSQGEVVVMLPGMGRGADEFRELAAALNEAGYRTVAIQPRGIGRSGPILTNPTYEKFADDVELILKDIPGGISGGKAHLIGYEFGNRIARMFAVKYPTRTRSLILLACGGQDTSSSQSKTKSSSPAPKKTKKVASLETPSYNASNITHKIDSFFQSIAKKTAKSDPQHIDISGMAGAFAFWLTPDVREQYVKTAFFAPTSKVPYYWVSGWYRDAGWMQSAMDLDHSSASADWVSGGSAPMLILNGEHDLAAPLSNAEYMKKTYPDRVTMFVVPKAAHAMLAEQPKFIINKVVAYLNQHPIK